MDDRTPPPAAVLLAISPHLDDAAFGCGERLAQHPGSVVLTVFAGAPADGATSTEWDRASGFASAREAVEARRCEDRSALALLGAEPRWLDFGDAQYGHTPALDAVADALEAAIDALRPATVLLPMGLFHSDHALVHEAALAVWRRRPRGAAHWLAYEDALYRRLHGLLQQRLVRLHACGVTATPAAAARGNAQRKAQALRCYASQLRALATPGRPGHADGAEPERHWTLALER